MFCPYCGSNVPGDTQFCPQCGGVLTPEAPTQPAYQEPVAPPAPANHPVIPDPATPQQPALSMGWFKFLIYFSLFASAVLNLISAIQFLSGSNYGEYSSLIYQQMPSLKTLDVLVGLISLAAAALALFTRFQLSGYKKNGPKFLSLVYAVNIIIQLVYIIGLYFVFGDDTGTILADSIASTVSSIIVSIAMIGINGSYFKKRASLFVN